MAPVSMDSLVADLCAGANSTATRLHKTDFAEHFQWLSEIVEETAKQLWGADEGDEENRRPDEPAESAAGAGDVSVEQPAGPYLLPRTPSMKRRRKDQTDQASRLAALNASLLDTSTNTRSRRAASRVADLKRALQSQQPRGKMRRPRSSCVRAEQQLVEQVRLGRRVAAPDTESDSEPEQQERRRPPRRAKRSPPAEPHTPPAGKRSRTRAAEQPSSPYIRVEEKPAVRTMVRAYEAHIVATSDDNGTPGRAARPDAAPATPKTPVPLPRHKTCAQTPPPLKPRTVQQTTPPPPPPAQKTASPKTPPSKPSETPAPVAAAVSPVAAQGRRQTRSRAAAAPEPAPLRPAVESEKPVPVVAAESAPPQDQADSGGSTPPATSGDSSDQVMAADSADSAPDEPMETDEPEDAGEETGPTEDEVQQEPEADKKSLRRVSSAPEVTDVGAVRRMTRTRAAVNLPEVKPASPPADSRRQTRTRAMEVEMAEPTAEGRRQTRSRAVEPETEQTSAAESRRQTRTRAMEVDTAEQPSAAESRRQTRTRAAEAETTEQSSAAESRRQTRTRAMEADMTEQLSAAENRRQTRTRAAEAESAESKSQPVEPETAEQTSPPADSGEERRQTRSRAPPEDQRPLRRVSSAPDVRPSRAARAAADVSQASSQGSPSEWGDRSTNTASKPNRGKASRFTPQPGRTRGANIAMPVDGSFIQRAPARPTTEELEQKRRLEAQKKREREEEARRKRDEMIRQRTEETSLKRQERQQRALEQRRQLAEEQRRALREKQRLQDERAGAAQRDTERKRHEEALRKRRALAERQREIDEKRRADEQARAARARQQQQEEEERRRQQQAREQERIAREKAECARLAEREAALKAEREAAQKATEEAAKKTAEAAATKPLPPPTKANLNSTFTLDEDERTAPPAPPAAPAAPTSYQITPGRDELPPQPLRDKNNYNIDDLKSDDDTDDESAPRKEIPAWASKSRLQTALIRQTYQGLDPDSIFPRDELFPAIKLEHIFALAKRRFFKRTSSAHWDTPPKRP